MTVMMGGALDAQVLADLNEETRAAVLAAMAAHESMAEHAGKGVGEARLMFLGEAD